MISGAYFQFRNKISKRYKEILGQITQQEDIPRTCISTYILSLDSPPAGAAREELNVLSSGNGVFSNIPFQAM